MGFWLGWAAGLGWIWEFHWDWGLPLQECAARGEDYERVKLLEISAEDAERWERKKKKKNPDLGFSGEGSAALGCPCRSPGCVFGVRRGVRALDCPGVLLGACLG